MAESFHTPFGDIDPAAVETATAAAAQANSRKDIEEITIKFAKGLCSDPFMSKSGKEYVRIQIPNSDPADHDPWQEFVLESKQVHENQYGKGLWAKLPVDGHTTVIKYDYYIAGGLLVRENADGSLPAFSDFAYKSPKVLILTSFGDL